MDEKRGFSDNGGLLWKVISLMSLLGVIVLFFMRNTGSDQPPMQKPVMRSVVDTSGNQQLRVAFVNTDEILDKYLLVQQLSKKLQGEEKKREDQLIARQTAYEKDATYFQEQIANSTISEKAAQEIYEQLMLEQEKIVRMRDEFTSELSAKEFEMNTILLDSIGNYLSRLNVNEEYDYILSYNRGGSIMFARELYDLTQEVIEGLNREYVVRYPEKK